MHLISQSKWKHRCRSLIASNWSCQLVTHQLTLMRSTLETFQVKIWRLTKSPVVGNETTTTRKVDTTTIRVTATTTDTTLKTRITSQVTNENAKRGMQRSPLYNLLILCLQNLQIYSTDILTWPCS